jgi:predicted DCC family thiol-disulfide oxidoreductase YuxK
LIATIATRKEPFLAKIVNLTTAIIFYFLVTSNKHIILFDGVCNLCNSSVQFVIKHDKKNVFSFASLQSELGQQLLAGQEQLPEDLDSIVYFDGKKAFIKSRAILRIFRKLGGLWLIAMVFWLVPRVFRDVIYDWIARKRYVWFGKKEACMIPTPGLKERFID